MSSFSKTLSLLFPLTFVLSLNACTSAQKSNATEAFTAFNGTFTCPAYKDGDIKTGGVDFPEHSFTQEIQSVNRLPVMVQTAIVGAPQESLNQPSLNAIDGKWHIKEFKDGKGNLIPKKVFAEFQGPKKIHWKSEMPAHKTKKGILRKAIKAEGYEWLDENGDMNYSASNFKDVVKCPRKL